MGASCPHFLLPKLEKEKKHEKTLCKRKLNGIRF